MLVTNNNLSNFLSYLNHHISSLSTNFTLKRGIQQIPKRPICPNCSKPIALCLCTRLKTPNLDNEVHITILQHRLERKHPLNSARIAKIGLRNVDVVNVSNAIFDAQFVIRPLGSDYEFGLVGGESAPGVCGNASESLYSDGCLEINGSRKRCFDYVDELDSGTGSAPSSAFDQLSSCSQEDISDFCIGGDNGALAKEDDCLLKQLDDDVVLGGRLGDKLTASGDDLMSMDAKKCNVICMTIGNYGNISSDEEKTVFDLLTSLISSFTMLHMKICTTSPHKRNNPTKIE